MGGGRWRDRENHHPAEQSFRETEGDVGTGGLEPRSAHRPVPARGLWAVLRVVSCRTATVWKTLCPFWGEEYEVHLPPTFHSVAFYVMDEDALRWVQPRSPSRARTPPLSLSGTAGHFASSLQPGRRGSPGDLQGTGLGCAVSVSVCVDSLCSHPTTRACVCCAVCAWGCELRNRYPERRAGRVGGHMRKSTCRHMPLRGPARESRVLLHVGSCK